MSDHKQTDSERAMARLLSDALRPQAGAASETACPDAEVLAAYAERNLDAAETALWERHFAECERCQKILAVLTVSGQEPLTDGELERFGRQVAAAQLGAPLKAPREPGQNVTSFERRRTAWRRLAPAVGIAAALALWIALRPVPRPAAVVITAQKSASEPAGPPSSLEAQANVPAPPAAAERQAEEQQARPSEFARALKKQVAPTGPAAPAQPSSAPPASEPTPAAPAQPQTPPVLQAANQAPENLTRAKQNENVGIAAGATSATANPNAAGASASQAGPAGAVPAAAPPIPPATSADASAPAFAPPAQVAPAQAAASGNAPAEAKASPSRTVQSFAASRAVGGLGAFRPGRIVTVATPNASVSWRVGPGGTIQRSADRGLSWQSQASGVTTDLLAGAAPSGQVAWIAGRAGVILRTTDGEHWQRIPSPDVSADWAAIDATDAQHATVSSTDQRRYATEDGGQSWKQ